VDWTTLAVVAVIAAATLVRGLLGFGNALVAMPLLALFLPKEVKEVVSPLVALTAMVTGSIFLVQTWKHICLHNTGRLLPPRPPGNRNSYQFLAETAPTRPCGRGRARTRNAPGGSPACCG
jgi:hypothetical protein